MTSTSCAVIEIEKPLVKISNTAPSTMPSLKSYDEWTSLIGGNNFRRSYEIRSEHIATCGFPIVTFEVFQTLVQFLRNRKVIDVGCGLGYLSYHLRRVCIDITPVDSFETKYSLKTETGAFEHKPHVVQGDAVELLNSTYDVVIMSWPDYDTDFASRIADKMTKGQILIYQGEGAYGCTGDETFHDMLDSDFTELELSRELYDKHIRFAGIHDHWNVYVKN